MVNRFFPAVLAAVSVVPVQMGAKDGTGIFAEHCASCHGLDGKARTPAGRKIGARDLSESKISDADIAQHIRAGVKDSKGTPRMPAFAEKLTAAEVAALVAHVKSFRR